MNVQVLGDDYEQMLGGFADVFTNILTNVGKVASNVGKTAVKIAQTPAGQALVATAITKMSPTQKATLAQTQAAMGMTPIPMTGVSQSPLVMPVPAQPKGFDVQKNLPLIAMGGAAILAFLFMMGTMKAR